MKDEKYLLELCNNDIEIFIIVRDVFERKSKIHNRQIENIVFKFIDSDIQNLDNNFSEKWHLLLQNRYTEYPEYFV